MRFRIDLKIFLIIILYIITKQIETYSYIMFFALIHEFGHLIMGLILGMKPQKLEIIPFGISISFKTNPIDYNKKVLHGNLMELKKIIIAFAGPLTNLIIIFLVKNISLNVFQCLMIIYSNLLLFLFNLLPIYPLDGGRILKSMLYILCGKKRSEKYINNISFTILIIVSFIGSISIYTYKNISVFIIIVALWIIFVREDIIFRRKNKIYKMIEKTIENN